MNLLEWIVAGTAELVVAYRENWRMEQISRHAWTVFAIYFTVPLLIITLVVG
ncbi:hypothetical protein [Mycobacterium aquaticum]|uniref:hypothetical protein n=1 Tax=Mycobacterium aquaticum TaxID=1927124 RepID=UPI001301AA42|nr:hypothetical protein [Mycobacterium aquaticum]